MPISILCVTQNHNAPRRLPRHPGNKQPDLNMSELQPSLSVIQRTPRQANTARKSATILTSISEKNVFRRGHLFGFIVGPELTRGLPRVQGVSEFTVNPVSQVCQTFQKGLQEAQAGHTVAPPGRPIRRIRRASARLLAPGPPHFAREGCQNPPQDGAIRPQDGPRGPGRGFGPRAAPRAPAGGGATVWPAWASWRPFWKV